MRRQRCIGMKIRKLSTGEPVPMDLLLLADPSEEMIQSYLADGDCYLAEDEDSVIGVYVLAQTKTDKVEIMNVAVREELRDQGMGKLLILDAIEKAKLAGYKTIEIGTGNSSIGQLALYQKCGFRLSSIDKDFFIRNYNEEIFENGIQCRDMVRLTLEISPKNE
jgi:ribosomal protein S18 acetylase RimI-like enzyme